MNRTIAIVAILALAACEQPSAPPVESRALAVPFALNNKAGVTKENLKVDFTDDRFAVHR